MSHSKEVTIHSDVCHKGRFINKTIQNASHPCTLKECCLVKIGSQSAVSVYLAYFVSLM